MKRDLEKICSGVLDVLVVGGGIHGATIAYHAAKAGYRTAIVDRNDFCAATSANSLKILHGGLRYLQHGNVKRMRHSILSRREMMRLASHLVKPLPCLMPLYGSGLRGRMVMRTALFLNDLVSWDRNQGLPEDIHLPSGRLESVEKCLEIVPGIAREDLRGAAVWYDVLAMDTERLVLEYILEGVSYGAGAANYAEVKAVTENSDTYLVSVADRLTDRTHQLHTRFIVNAAGPWFQKRLTEGNGPNKQQWALALNLVSRKKIFDEFAVALEGQASYQDKDALVKRNRRLYFFVPWRGYTMIGTEYEASRAAPDDLRVSRETLRKMVDEVNAIYPPAKLRYDDISFYHAGLLPSGDSSESNQVQLEKNSTLVASADTSSRGILSLKSVKYTTAPHMAHEVVGYLKKKLSPDHSPVRKGKIEGKNPGSGRHPELKRLLEKRYGPRGELILAYLKDDLEGDPWLDKSSCLLKAEVEYLVAEEMACKLSDAVFRRTGLGTAECPPEDVLYAAASYMGNILGWDETRQEQEVKEVLSRYEPLILA